MESLFQEKDAPTFDDVIDESAEGSAFPLGEAKELHRREEGGKSLSAKPETARALALTDVIAPRSSAGEALIRMAYRMGVPGHALAAPFRKKAAIRLLATVDSPIRGERAAGTALRAGHFLVHGVKTPIGQVDFDCNTRQSAGFERVLHSFSWLSDLAASAPRRDCTAIAERITGSWIAAHPEPGKGNAWTVEHAGMRLLAWLVHAPLILSSQDGKLRPRLLNAIDETASWLDRKAPRDGAGFGQVAGFAAITAAGLLLPEGKPRRLFGEAALIRALGDLVAEDGGVLSRCPATQMDAIALLTDLLACYEAVEIDPPQALGVMRELLVPPLLTLRHGDGALGNWQGQGAIGAHKVAALIAATGVRTRPLKEVEHWGFQRMKGGDTVVQFDTAPPPRARHARMGCASTLAFEVSDGPCRLIVNCGGAATAGGQVPARIGQGLRASAAHSTLVLNDANSTAVLLHGKLGKGVELVETETRQLRNHGHDATRIEASHDGYAARFGLSHRRVLSLRSDGTVLAGEDILVPASRKGKRGKVGFAIRFHLGYGVETQLSEDKRGASLLLPDGSLWQFRMRSDAGAEGDIGLSIEESLWVDGDGRPHPTEQLVIDGMTSRSGGQFSWLFKKMG